MTPHPVNTLIWDNPDDPVNVLVLDDDQYLREIAERALSRAGFHVMTAKEGSEGLQVLLSNRIDVVVSDLMMEPMDGITFLTEALRIWPWIGVVVFSGYMREELQQKATELGVRMILEKPLAFDKLIRSVIEEAHRMRNLVGGQGALTLSRVLYQVNMLKDNARMAIESTSMQEALLKLCHDLGMMIPSTLTAIMTQPDDSTSPILAVSLLKPVPATYRSHIENIVRERYSVLSGKRLPADIEWVFTGAAEDENSPMPKGEPLSFPIISGSCISGVLVLVPPDDFNCSESDVSFLYHAANHFTTVLNAFHRIRELALRDGLTGLFNRHYLQQALSGAWDMASQHGLNPAIMIMDVDHFKVINDTYGHAAGDLVMRMLADIITEACRSSDLVVRYGGDEIMIIVQDADTDGSAKLADRIQRAIRNHLFSPLDFTFHCTVSIGVACCREQDGNMLPPEQLLNQADEALYTAKNNGRNRTVIWTPPEKGAPTKYLPEETTPARITPSPPGILIVDDDPTILHLMKTLLDHEKRNLHLFERADTALQHLDNHPDTDYVALIDLNLHDMEGLALIGQMHARNPLLIPIIITGDATTDTALHCLRHGAYDFIQKPVRQGLLKSTLQRAMEYSRLRRENQTYHQDLENLTRQKNLELASALQRTRESFDFTLRAMTAMMDAREHFTGSHSIRVQEITVMMARKYNFSDHELDGIRHGALLHDIGKIALPDRILLKAGPLNDEERQIMRQHVEIGYELVKPNRDLQAAADIMLCHHENFNGSGYPKGLKGDDIPLAARIFSVVDSYDAMRSTRPYRIGMPRQTAIAELQSNSGTQFDPAVVRVFLQHIEAVEAMGEWETDHQETPGCATAENAVT